MKKVVLAASAAVLFSLSIGVNQGFAERDGYERVEEECTNGGFQIRCRWNDLAKCDVSEQTTCGETIQGIG